MSVPRRLVLVLALGIALLGVSCLQPVEVGFDQVEVGVDAGMDAGVCLPGDVTCP